MSWGSERRAATASRRNDRASSLMLVPAGILVIVLLGGIAIDLSAAHLAQRRLVQVTERAADDAAGMLDSDSLRSGGPARVSPGAAQNLARLQVSAFDVPALQNTGTAVSIGRDGRSVTVSTTATVRRLFGAALPGVAPTYRVTARATARLE
ncbi:MAG: pilus assembly protein TadG-related protein [Candidatus Microthrix parvicella]